MQTTLEDFQNRLRNVIQNTCNTIGCDQCDLKWKDESGRENCSAIELQSKITDIEFSEVKS